MTMALAFTSGALLEQPRGTGMSEEAKGVDEKVIQRQKVERQSAVLGDSENAILTRAVEILIEHAEDDWDGYEARAVNRDSLVNALSLALLLGTQYPSPEMAVDPDGEVTLDWICGAGRVFSISTSATGRLAYAWMKGNDQGSATSQLSGRTVPDEIVSVLRRVIG